MKILITGAHGRLGKELVKILSTRHTLLTPHHWELELIDYKDVANYVDKHHPDMTIHCAAYTRVIDAETDKAACWATNVIATQNISYLSPLKFLYISTDYVFDGEKGMYKENSVPNPKTYYGMTKLIGEEVSMAAPHKKLVIARLSFRDRHWPYKNALMDAYTSADFTDVIAYQVSQLVEKFDKCDYLMHLGTERKSLFELASNSSTPNVTPSSRSWGGFDHVPKDCSLDTSLFKAFLRSNYRIPV